MPKTQAETDTLPFTLIYCDGACSGNPGPGGWGAVVATPQGQVRELGGGNPRTTNNQMEMTAILEALRSLGSAAGDVVVYTDSTYAIRGITQWVFGWMRRGWKTAEGKEVLNKELWQELFEVVSQRKKHGQISWKYVRGHTGVAGNERCDVIAVGFSKGLHVDLYEGPAVYYGPAIFELPPDQPLPDMTNRSGEKKAAHSYVSLLGGTPMRHSSWTECERRVKGQPGAKFKKANSADDEAAILRSWGVDPKKLQG